MVLFLFLVFPFYLLPVIIIHIIGYIIWRTDPDTKSQHTVEDLYDYYAYNYDKVIIASAWCPVINIAVLVIIISVCLFSFVSNIRIK